MSGSGPPPCWVRKPTRHSRNPFVLGSRAVALVDSRTSSPVHRFWGLYAAAALPWLALPADASAQTPIDDPLGGAPYLGMYELGAYPDAANEMPPEHHAAGLALANAVVPLDADGNPDPVNGEIVLLSVGMSNTAGPWCNLNGSIPVLRNPDGSIPCYAWTLMGRMRHPG